MQLKMDACPSKPFRRRASSGLCLSLLSLGLFLLVTACARYPHLRVEPFPEQEALFQRTEGWTGGDGVFSVPLDGERILWLFGDTFIGKVVRGRHVEAELVNNTLALQEGRNPSAARVDFYWTQEGGKAGAFFRPPDGRGWFWPYHGIRTPFGLYLFLIQVERGPGPVGFDFKPVASWLAVVKQPDRPPKEWEVDMHRIPFSHEGRIFGSAVLPADEQVLIYGVADRQTAGLTEKTVLLARAPAENPADFSRWVFFAPEGWVRDPDQAEPVCRQGANEFSVTYQPALKRFVMVHTEDSLSEHIVYRLAERPEGPFGDPVRFYRCPEVRWEPRVFCYAAKGHASLSRSPEDLVFSYTTNSTDFGLIENDARFYRPRFLRLFFRGDGDGR